MMATIAIVAALVVMDVAAGDRVCADGKTYHASDGDTYWHCPSRTKNRIVQFDAPELRGKCSRERAMALAAREALQRHLDTGRVVAHPFRSSRGPDRYGRVLVAPTLDGRPLAEILESEGHGKYWDYEDRGRRPTWC